MVSATVMEAVHVDCICARTSVINECKATDKRIATTRQDTATWRVKTV